MITFANVTYTYPEASHPVIHDVSLHVAEGSFALVMGLSGAGKSTLLRCINGLVPHFSGGVLSGTIAVDGLDPVLETPKVMSRHVGFVFQDPEGQFVMDRVEDEVAFSLENAGIPPEEMQLRVGEALALLGLTHLRRRRLETLSGGEKQKVAIASALVLQPRVLVLDEPTSQLDPQSAADVLGALAKLNAELGLSVILAEHRLERVLPFVDQIIYLPGDGTLRQGTPECILPEIDLVPPLIHLGQALGWTPLPLTIEDGLKFSSALMAGQPSLDAPVSQPALTYPLRTPYLEASGIEVMYGTHTVLKGVDLRLYSGEVLALLGGNGVGKTTLLKTLVGLVQPTKGWVRVAGRSIVGWKVAEICRSVGYLPQDPNALLFADSVLDELRITLRNHNIAELDAPIAPQSLLSHLGMADKAGIYPRDLSVGERQRVALGAIMITRPGVLLLDEPTRGLDYLAKQHLLSLLRNWRDEGMAILLVTHDVELAAAIADRVMIMDQGQVVALGDPHVILGESSRFAPQVARLFPGSGWLVAQDVLSGLVTGAETKRRP